MPTFPETDLVPSSITRRVAAAALALLCAPLAQGQDAATLKARHAALRSQLSDNVFGQPIHLVSSEESGTLKGEVFARIDQPFSTLGPALAERAHWCDILILHLNVKGCRVNGGSLNLNVGRKFDQPTEDTYAIAFRFDPPALDTDFLNLALGAAEGPVGTRDYQIRVQAVALDGKTSFLHFSYAYSNGVSARLALKSYLSTLGRDKVGFSLAGRSASGEPQYVGGTRGVIERNTMRYFLAVDAYLDSLALPEAQQVERRLADWHAGVERYPRQLHELTRDEYLSMKRKEIARQQGLAVTS